MSSNSASPPNVPNEKLMPANWVVGHDEMSEMIRSREWSATPLGALDTWPQVLRTAVNLIMASSFPMAILWGSDLTLIYNDAYRVIAAEKHPEAMGRPTHEVWPEVWGFSKPICDQVMARGETVHLEDQLFHIARRDSIMEDAYFTLSCSPISEEGGQVVGTLVVLQETTPRLLLEGRLKQANETLAVQLAERKQAEEALRKSTEKNLEILESISDAFFSLDDDMVVKYFNHAAERMLNRKASEVIGRRLFDAFPEARGSVFEENYSECIRSKTALSFEAELAVAPYENWYEVRVYPEKNGISVFFQVITERKQAEEQIRVLNGRLQHQVAELEAANSELDAFTYSVAHDLRGPIRHIESFSRIVMDKFRENLDEDGWGYLRRVREASLKMDRLISDLLNLSHASRQNLATADVDLGDIASDIAASLNEQSADRKVEFLIAGTLRAAVDPHLIRIVFDNLLGNAWKFTSKTENARIEFGVLGQNGNSVYYIKDNGVGFDPEYADKLFKPFQRLHADKDFEGTGIGLAIVERIIRRHGGKIWAEGQVDKGATFYFTLPQK